MTSGLVVPKESQLKYLNRRNDEIEKSFVAIRSMDFELAQKMGHQMKGNASTFNFLSLEPIAQRLEEAALREDLSSTQNILEELKSEVLRLLHQLS